MKHRVFYLILLLLGLATLGYSVDLINEGFEGAFPPSGWTTYGYSSYTQSSLQAHTGTCSARSVTTSTNNDSSFIQTPLLTTPGNFTFWAYRTGSNNGNSLHIRYSTQADPDTWLTVTGDIGTTTITTSWAQYSLDLSGYSNINVKFCWNHSSVVYIDDISIASDLISSPSISISISGNDIVLNWNTVAGAATYNIYRSFDRYGAFSLLGSTSNTGYTLTGAFSTYESSFYRITSIGARVESNPSNIVGCFKKSIESGGWDAFTLPFGYTDLSPNSVLGNQFNDRDMLIDMTDPLGLNAMYLTGVGWVGGLQTMTYDHSYLINRDGSNPSINYYLLGTVSYPGVEVHISGADEGKWTAFGLNDCGPVDLNNLVISGILDFDMIIDISDGTSTTYDPEFGWYGELTSIIPAHGYWYYSTSYTSFDFIYNHVGRKEIYPGAKVKPVIEPIKNGIER